MMKVGLEISDASIPRPSATPRARTVFPVPSSPASAKTSPGRAMRPRRSPRRSVCSEEWLTRSSEATSRDRSATSRATLELPALEHEPNGDAEERAEERRPNREPPLLRDLTEELDARAAAERAREGDETERADERSPAPERDLARLERFTPLLFRALLTPLGLRRTVFGRVAPLAAPLASCHRPQASARAASGRRR